jgi:glycosyltransferase involved in cell wall biosynthesis
VDSSSVETEYALKGKFVVLFVGALTSWHGYKGLDVLLDSMRYVVKAVPNAVLLVVGEGNLRPQYESLTRDFGLQSCVIFARDVPDKRLPDCYAAADVGVVPSKDMSEGFGLTVLEANATGRPCIGSNTGGIPEVLRNEHNGLLVPPKDAQSLAKAIVRLARDDDERVRMGRNGRSVALLHDWKIVAEETEGLYLKVVES